jgi:hypothetical protein
MADQTTTSTVILVDHAVGPDFTAIMRAMETARGMVYDAIALPPEALRSPEPSTADLIRRLQAEAMPKLYGMQVMVSKALEGMRWPVRVHKKRRNQSEAYHRRIQKKWTKRYGTAPAVVLMNREAFLSPPSTRTKETR